MKSLKNITFHFLFKLTLKLIAHILGKRDMNVIMWLDHRAAEQAERINATQHEVLKYVGGKISLEMQTPKLLWIKEVVFCGYWPWLEVEIPVFNTALHSAKWAH